MTKNELDASMGKLSIAQDLYNNAVHTRSTYDSFKGVVRDSIREAGRFDIKPVKCYSVEIPLTDDEQRALDIFEGVLKQRSEKAVSAFVEFKI